MQVTPEDGGKPWDKDEEEVEDEISLFKRAIIFQTQTLSALDILNAPCISKFSCRNLWKII